jgi:hypothetical protein
MGSIINEHQKTSTISHCPMYLKYSLTSLLVFFMIERDNESGDSINAVNILITGGQDRRTKLHKDNKEALIKLYSDSQ